MNSEYISWKMQFVLHKYELCGFSLYSFSVRSLQTAHPDEAHCQGEGAALLQRS